MAGRGAVVRINSSQARSAVRGKEGRIVAQVADIARDEAKATVRVDTGYLREHIVRESPAPMVEAVHADAEYAIHIELLDPYLVPAAQRAAQELPQIVAGEQVD